MNKLMLLFLLFCLSGCVTYERCVDKYGQAPKDTVYVPCEKLVPVSFVVPADSIQGAVDPDTLVDGVIHEITNQNSNLTLQYWMDAYNRLLHMKAVNPSRTVRDTVLIRDTVPCPPQEPVFVQPVKPKSRLERFTDRYKDWTAWTLPALIFVLMLIWRFK